MTIEPLVIAEFMDRSTPAEDQGVWPMVSAKFPALEFSDFLPLMLMTEAHGTVATVAMLKVAPLERWQALHFRAPKRSRNDLLRADNEQQARAKIVRMLEQSARELAQEARELREEADRLDRKAADVERFKEEVTSGEVA
jgi:hypothetical protein